SSSFLLLSFSIILPYLIVDLKLCNRTKKSFYGCSNYPECKFTLAEHFRKKKLTKTNVKELLEGKETLVKGIKTKDRKSYNAVVKIGEKGYIDFISFSK
ncbi:TPA: topoisomerase C-terminal repeat-containing protein, partial [Enterococcus faecium]